MQLPTLSEIETAAEGIYEGLMPTPQLQWPLLNLRTGCHVVVKHENHLPTGSFKVRGGLWYAKNRLSGGSVKGIIAATRGNHGQSIAYAASQCDCSATIVVPEGNNEDKNAAMVAYGAELIVFGEGFDDALNHAQQLGASRDLAFVPSFDRVLIEGVASYGLELLQAYRDLDRIYVPIGLGSGICGVLAARAALGLETEVVGVVAANADTYRQSLAAGRVIATASANTLADGLAVRAANDDALALISAHVERIVAVSDLEIEQAIAHLITDTHNLAEGAGAASLAALLQDQRGIEFSLGSAQSAGIILSGGNLARNQLARIGRF